MRHFFIVTSLRPKSRIVAIDCKNEVSTRLSFLRFCSLCPRHKYWHLQVAHQIELNWKRFMCCRRAIREALISGNASGQEIVEELDNLSMFNRSPSDDLRDRNFMSPSSNDWSRAFGWAGNFHVLAESLFFSCKPSQYWIWRFVDFYYKRQKRLPRECMCMVSTFGW